ncbi:hypothetical protein GW17_00016256 [Ensete ventricosum]|nr:hypothetical protein GW17_00016256 [Ensete ventricosum]
MSNDLCSPGGSNCLPCRHLYFYLRQSTIVDSSAKYFCKIAGPIASLVPVAVSSTAVATSSAESSRVFPLPPQS